MHIGCAGRSASTQIVASPAGTTLAWRMSNRTISIDDRLYRYLLEHSLRETPEMRALRETTATLRWRAHMQISPEQGQFMALLVELTGARRIIEIGTSPASARCAWPAQCLPDGELVCCDVSTEWTAVGIPFWGARRRA